MNKLSVITPICLVLLVYCTDNRISGTVSDTDTGRSAIIYNPDLTPAIDATVKFFGVNDTTRQAELETKTDSDGRYSVRGLNKGTYNIIAKKDSLVTFQDSVFISPEANTITPDTLGNPGSITGIIGLQPNHNPRTVTVQVLGTDIYSGVDANGKFTLSPLATGTYNLRLVTTLPEYTPTFVNITAEAGEKDTLSDTLWLTYTGIPVILGLNARYDTTNGCVTLSWKRPIYNDLQDFVVYRDFSDSVNFSTKPFMSTNDTVIKDTIYSRTINSGSFSFSDTNNYKFRYRVAIRNNSQKIGDTYKYSELNTCSYMRSSSLLPKVDNLQAVFDTLSGTMKLSWNDVDTFSGFDGYLVLRKISESNLFDVITDTFVDTVGIFTNPEISDSLFNRKLSFADSNYYKVSYLVSVHNKDWNLFGRNTISNTIEIQPYVQMVPKVDSIRIQYDTLKGIVTVSWDSLKSFTNLEHFVVTRWIRNANSNVNMRDTLTTSTNRVVDTIYPKCVGFGEITGTNVSYTIAVKHSIWKIPGMERIQNTTIFSYKKYKPVVTAGPDQNVDIGTDVVLQGRIISTTWAIKKFEWKIGTADWVVTDSGTTSFKTSSTFDRESIVCLFRATDSAGNVAYDSMNVVKQQMVVTFGKFPSKSGPAQGTSTIINSSEKFLGKYWYIGDIDYGKYACWSTSDFNSWVLESAAPGIMNTGAMVSAGEYLFSIVASSNRYWRSYRSKNGRDWEEIIPVNTFFIGDIWTNFCRFDSKLYIIGHRPFAQSDSLYWSNDGVEWARNAIGTDVLYGSDQRFLNGFKDKLYLITRNKRLTSSDKGGTWIQDPLWDIDYTNFPDDVYWIGSNDSVLVAYYIERPSGVVKVSMLRNGSWSDVPIGGLTISTFYYSTILFLYEGRLMFITYSSYYSNPYSMNSIKLY